MKIKNDHEGSASRLYTQLYEGARGGGPPPPDPAVQPTIRAGLLKNIARVLVLLSVVSCQLVIVIWSFYQGAGRGKLVSLYT